ncbi:M23 family metallopeptidase [Planococcus dechangensis]|uniref:M23 family metallopeptidase n=1 Tax=Planococcus dechangensis TaxID=1176255 RepID=A0ABV9MGJ5_9BACL
MIDHHNGYETIYAHLSSIDVKVRERVIPQTSNSAIWAPQGALQESISISNCPLKARTATLWIM